MLELETKVLVVSGITASGKTSLITALKQICLESTVLSFDDYDIVQLSTTPNIKIPLKKAINQYDISELMLDFKQSYHQIPLILLDFPFGYYHQELRPYIDWVVYLNTPLDITFARQLIRDEQSSNAQEIINWAKTYLSQARPYFVDNQSYVAQSADLILDGTTSIAQEVAQVRKLIE